MPTASQHQNKAMRNEAFLGTVPLGFAPEWAATVAFYAALHHVERLRDHAGDGHSAGHADRLSYVRARWRAIFVAFDRLHQASTTARYEPSARFFRLYPAADVQVILIDQDLRQVRDFVATACAPPPPPPAP